MPTGSPMPSWSSTTKSCGSTCRISRPFGSATALAASIARRTSSRVISRFLPGDGHDAAAVEGLDVGARQRQVHRVDLDAGGQLRLLDRLLDRLDRRLEVDHDAAADALRVGRADPDDVERRHRRYLADDRGDLGGADVQTHQVAFLTCHGVLPFSNCLSCAWRPRLCRRSHRRAAARARAGLHVHAARRTADPRSRCPAPFAQAPSRSR